MRSPASTHMYRGVAATSTYTYSGGPVDMACVSTTVAQIAGNTPTAFTLEYALVMARTDSTLNALIENSLLSPTSGETLRDARQYFTRPRDSVTQAFDALTMALNTKNAVALASVQWPTRGSAGSDDSGGSVISKKKSISPQSDGKPRI